MNRAERRKQNKFNRKNNISNNRYAINFTHDIMNDEKYKFNLLCVYNDESIKDIKKYDYDNDKCFDIINENISNLFVLKAGNADMSNIKVKKTIEQNMRSTALAVLIMTANDPYKSVTLNTPDCVLEQHLSDLDGNIGFNLLNDSSSMLHMQKGIQNRINNAKQDGVDAVVVMS
tara:strand:- start:46 stop:567 length:522 start_codon:yes stop_codon:yes gene_type:complete